MMLQSMIHIKLLKLKHSKSSQMDTQKHANYFSNALYQSNGSAHITQLQNGVRYVFTTYRNTWSTQQKGKLSIQYFNFTLEHSL